MHELDPFYARYFVFNLHSTFNECMTQLIIFLHDSFQPVFSDYFQGTGDQLKINFRKRIQEINTLALQGLVLNSLFLLIKTSSVDNGSIKVGKIYNQVCFQKNVFNFLKYVFKDFDLGKTFQLLKLSFTYTVKELMVYDHFSRNYGHSVNHD